MDSRRQLLSRANAPASPAASAIKIVAAATDFTAGAALAVRRAGQLCRAYGAQLHLIHVIHSPRSHAGVMLPTLRPRSRLTASGAVSHLRQTAARIIAEFGVPVETHLGVGNVSQEIATLAHAAGADLIVVGNPEKSLLSEILGIHTALRVQRRTALPVLAVSCPALRRYTCVVLVSDLSVQAARVAQRALQFFPDSRLALFHAFDLPPAGLRGTAQPEEQAPADFRRVEREALERLSAFARDASLHRDTTLHVDSRAPAVSVRSLARELDGDLVVVRPVPIWLASGVTEQLLVEPPCDLLLMP